MPFVCGRKTKKARPFIPSLLTNWKYYLKDGKPGGMVHGDVPLPFMIKWIIVILHSGVCHYSP
jgi:hypothetical protein